MGIELADGTRRILGELESEGFEAYAVGARKAIRCIGAPRRRFEEDALTALRCLSLAAQLDLDIEEETAQAIDECAVLIPRLPSERIGKEFGDVVGGRAGASVLGAHTEVFAGFIPEIYPLVGLRQRNPLHIYDVWGHTLSALEHQESDDLATRMATFFHDFGKVAENPGEDPGAPRMAKPGKHGEASAGLCRSILGRLCFPEAFAEECALIVEAHDQMIENDDRSVASWLDRLTPDTFFKVLDLKRADIAGHGPEAALHVVDMDRLADRARRLLNEDASANA